MSFIRNLFFRSQPDDFETVLSKLHDDIQRRTSLLSELRLRERRSTLLVTLYTLALWCAYTVIWYLVFREGGDWLQGVPVFVGPIAILFVRRIVQIYYKRKGDGEERTLRSLRKTQREKVDEFKKKTNFNETRSLLEKYDDSQPSTPVNRRGPAPVPGGGSVMSPTPARAPGGSVIQQQQPKQRAVPAPIMTNGAAAPGTPLPPHLIGAPTPQPYTPGPKKWYDKVADAILGDDDDPRAGAAASRYALICEQCFKHNGLVKESMWEDTQYVCPKCGHFNASFRVKSSSKRSELGRSASGSPPLADDSPLAHRRPEPETPSQPFRPSQFNSRQPPIPIIAVSSESNEGMTRISDDEDAGSARPEKKKARSRKKGKKVENGGDESMMDVDEQ